MLLREEQWSLEASSLLASDVIRRSCHTGFYAGINFLPASWVTLRVEACDAGANSRFAPPSAQVVSAILYALRQRTPPGLLVVEAHRKGDRYPPDIHLWISMLEF